MANIQSNQITRFSDFKSDDRINSSRATQFRIWATQRLKDYLVTGYSINKKRLEKLGKIVQLIEQSGKTENLQLREATGLLEILGNYTKSFVLLNQYDSHNLQPVRLNENITYEIIRSAMATNVSAHFCLYGFWKKQTPFQIFG